MSATLLNPLTGLPIDDQELESLSSLVEKQLELEGRIEKGEALLKQLKSELEEVSTHQIPDKLDQLGISQIKTKEGRTVTVKPFYSCKVLDPAAYAWLDQHGHGGIIKTKLVREYLRTERDEAVEYQRQHPEFRLDETIHHQTLSAFTKEIYSNNGSLPEEYFKVYQGSKTKIS